MALGKVATALVLLATALPAALASSSHVHIRIKSIDASDADPIVPSVSVAGRVVAVDAAQYKVAACAPQTWVIRGNNVTSIWLDFASINAPGDQVIVSALNGSQPQVFNVALGGTSTKPIAGKGVRVEFRPAPANVSSTGCAVTGKMPSFELSSIGYGVPKSVKKEEVCGANELYLSTCFSKRIDGKDNAVLRLRILQSNGDVGFCTAWLWGDKGHVITNNHCIPDKATAARVTLQFQVVTACGQKKCEALSCKAGEEVGGKYTFEFITTDKDMDMTLLQITKDPYGIARKYGFLKIRDGPPKVGESFYFVHHAGGKAKQISMDATGVPASAVANPSAANAHLFKFPTITDLKTSGYKAGRVKYMADTEHGASGSPIVATSDNAVIALHHGGDCPNYGAPSTILLDKLRNIGEWNNGIAP